MRHQKWVFFFVVFFNSAARNDDEIHLRVGQGGAEVFPDVRLQNGVKMLELSVCYQSNYKHLAKTRNLIKT